MQTGTSPRPQTAPPATLLAGPPAEELILEICAQMRATGLLETEAALSLGVPEQELRRWMEADRQLAVRFGQAQALFCVDTLRAIRSRRDKDGQVDWRAQAWMWDRSEEGRAARARQQAQEGVAEGGALVLGLEPLRELQRRRAESLTETSAR